ncbi:hypothetical protein [Desertibaculum subflavum]|uniref:hypothetical protein n=1 Tax=Desertibaculum subflavum TaxID=2268458 RepID=UPI000E660A4F
MRRRIRRARSNADTALAGKVLSAILTWTAVGAVALLALVILPGLARLVPLPEDMFAAATLLRAGLAGPTLGLVFVGWLLGVLAICTLAALRRLWRAPVVTPWISRPTAGRGA